jgi:hypothetical protein
MRVRKEVRNGTEVSLANGKVSMATFVALLQSVQFLF